jgi:hypothetical protein
MPDSPRSRRFLTAALIALTLADARAALAVKRRAFVTSITGTGNIASWPGASGATPLDKADAVCRARATAGNLPNPGTYRAWLSTATPGAATDAYCHVQGLSGQKQTACNGGTLTGGGPWYLANGITTWSGTLDQLTTAPGIIYRSVALDELLQPVSHDWETQRYWTGSFEGGQGSVSTCNDWASASAGDSGWSGDALGSAVVWTNSGAQACNTLRRLLCVEPGTGDATQQPWLPGAIVFATSARGTGALASWPAAAGATGVNAGYAICRNLAAAAHLPSPNSFVPWISTGAVDARDRLTTDGPFRRLDGYPIAGSVVDLLDGATQNSIHQYETGAYAWNTNPAVWTGTLADGTRDVHTCNGWTADADSGTTGGLGYARFDGWTRVNSYVCSAPFHLYCISNVVTVEWDSFESGDTGRWTVAVQ